MTITRHKVSVPHIFTRSQTMVGPQSSSTDPHPLRGFALINGINWPVEVYDSGQYVLSEILRYGTVRDTRNYTMRYGAGRLIMFTVRFVLHCIAP